MEIKSVCDLQGYCSPSVVSCSWRSLCPGRPIVPVSPPVPSSAYLVPLGLPPSHSLHYSSLPPFSTKSCTQQFIPNRNTGLVEDFAQ